MDNILNRISVSLIDINGEVNNGVVLLLNMMVDDEAFEIGYWFNKDNEVIISPEQKLLDYLEIDKINDFEYFNELLYFIHENIPNKEAILKEFVK